ncbi:MAG: hypothetical protein V4671_13615, partial [Armatimonadota bacterium]
MSIVAGQGDTYMDMCLTCAEKVRRREILRRGAEPVNGAAPSAGYTKRGKRARMREPGGRRHRPMAV